VKIKICGLFRAEDIDHVNEARPDYAGFVFAESRRQVSPGQAGQLRSRLADGIVPVGVFVDAPPETIAGLYRDGIIGIAQLHGSEDEEYIAKLKDICGIPVIKALITPPLLGAANRRFDASLREELGINLIEYFLVDSGAGSGKTFNWELLEEHQFDKPWFLAGGINLDNIEKAMALEPYAIDVSSGAETDGIKDRQKILQLIKAVRFRTAKEIQA